MSSIDLYRGFFSKKRVLITGHTGFKGSWLSIWLQALGADVTGISLNPYTDRDNYVLSGIGNKINDLRGDIRDLSLIKSIFADYKPEIIFHMAAQPLVRLSYKIPVDTYITNVIGTINIMEAVRTLPGKCVAVMVTTDKCYENREDGRAYKETDPLGGYDPYSSSKGAAEIAVSSWRSSFFNPDDTTNNKYIATARAGNVIGGGDWASDRIIPDCIRALESGKPIVIRNPKSLRPWQHVLEPLSGYMLLAERMWNNPQAFCGGWNFGPNVKTKASVLDIAQKVIKCYGRGEILDSRDKCAPHESGSLLLDITKSTTLLGWKPRLELNTAIELTADWYKRYKTEDVYNLCIEQIEKYTR